MTWEQSQYDPGTVLDTLHVWTHRMFPKALWGRPGYCHLLGTFLGALTYQQPHAPHEPGMKVMGKQRAVPSEPLTSLHFSQRGWRKTFRFCFNNLWDHLVMLRKISVGFQDASFFGLETWSWGCPKLQSTLPCGGTPPTRGIIHFHLAPRRRICARQKVDVQKSVRIRDNGINTHPIYHFLKLRSDMLTAPSVKQTND